MKLASEKGLTLVELLITITIMGIIAMATMPMLSTILEAHSQGTDRSGLYHEGLLAMERMTSGVRRCTFVLIPNAHNTNRDILAFSGFVNEDGDHYFNDPLFPRIDEDLKKQMTDDGMAGIIGLDDDGDALIDEGDQNDDDEDGLVDEDPFDGIDNDGDGNIDEDTGDDANIADMDDDADGSIDEGDTKDDDEDGIVNEDPLNPIVYSFDNGTNTLTESVPSTGQSVVLSTRVTQFQATYEAPDATHGPRVQIALTLTGADGESVQLVEYAYPRNILQNTGKRVR
jgi:prepilin-type N-terminal cleavage/methylation domain-containing protein